MEDEFGSIGCSHVLEFNACLIERVAHAWYARSIGLDVLRFVESGGDKHIARERRGAFSAEMRQRILAFNEPSRAEDLDCVVEYVDLNASERHPVPMDEGIEEDLAHGRSRDFRNFFPGAVTGYDEPPACVVENIELCLVHELEQGALLLMEVEYLGSRMRSEDSHFEPDPCRRAEHNLCGVCQPAASQKPESLKRVLNAAVLERDPSAFIAALYEAFKFLFVDIEQRALGFPFVPGGLAGSALDEQFLQLLSRERYILVGGSDAVFSVAGIGALFALELDFDVRAAGLFLNRLDRGAYRRRDGIADGLAHLAESGLRNLLSDNLAVGLYAEVKLTVAVLVED